MFFGVISYTFLVSHINSFLTNKTNLLKKRGKGVLFLEKLQKTYQFSQPLYKMALNLIKKSNLNDENKIDNLDYFLNFFPKNLKNELEIYMYESQVNAINMFKGLPNDIIIQIGQTLTPVIYTQSYSFYFEIKILIIFHKSIIK